MKYEDWLFEIYYSDLDEDYIDKLGNTVLSRDQKYSNSFILNLMGK